MGPLRASCRQPQAGSEGAPSQTNQPLKGSKIPSTAQKGQAEMGAPQKAAVSNCLPTQVEGPSSNIVWGKEMA